MSRLLLSIMTTGALQEEGSEARRRAGQGKGKGKGFTGQLQASCARYAVLRCAVLLRFAAWQRSTQVA